MINQAIKILNANTNLSAAQMAQVMEEILKGAAQTQEIVDFLTALNAKQETVEEIVAAVEVMRKYATKIKARDALVLDTCGTGGDKKGTFNISTCVAFVASACGITVAKHGNRSVSSCCGSADVLEALGINITQTPEKTEQCLNEIGIAFLFAQVFHPAMKYAMPARRQMGTKTMFNILGPLSNPASATHQLVGVYDWRWGETLAKVLARLGSRHALVVHGEDGLDELSLTGKTLIAEVSDGECVTHAVNPEDFNLPRAGIEDLQGKDIAVNARIILDILSGQRGPKRDIVVLNSAASLYAADKVTSIKGGITLAQEAIDSGKALAKLELLKEYSRK